MGTSPFVLIVGQPEDHLFWELTDQLSEFTLMEMNFSSTSQMEEDFRRLERRPSVVFLSVSIACSCIGQVIAWFKEQGDLDVVVAATQTDRLREIEARRAGIFCYLTLPGEMEAAFVVTQAALHLQAERAKWEIAE